MLFKTVVYHGILMLILSGTANPLTSISLIIETTDWRAEASSSWLPSSGIIFQPFLDPNDFLILNDTSCWLAFEFFRKSGSGHGLEHLELAAELFLEADFSLAFLKLLALLSSLLKLWTFFSWGEARWGLRRGEFGGSGERILRGDGDLESCRSWRSNGLGDLDTAGVDKGDNSLISQNSSLMSGVDCLLLGHEFSLVTSCSLATLSPILFRDFLGGVELVLGGVRRSLLGGVKLSRVLRLPRSDLFLASVTVFFSVADSLRFWFLRAVLKLSSLCISVLIPWHTDQVYVPT